MPRFQYASFILLTVYAEQTIQAIVLPTTISICTSMYGKIAFQNCINQVKIKLFVRMTGAYLKKRAPIQSSIFVELT